ncbi:hypothetical protein SERLADRAFT_437466 [Serpula lacrymans var. lacrymans S7.9]|uniref:Myb-like domain-containing protein n=1 Tax=Serpula lacrymans var. lacrymans (strain S7.9) TaxID=578457 RepID=F8NTR7_SERL9|nr:uncharacterized protein SERLADRAFT_437466 [Serpula lacrymans var. lacrymans S7.9]EGO25737.1 hypothetical protein SERLADRAFT_437466 [Serpula lacrymans var. lacrymans S7.9]
MSKRKASGSGLKASLHNYKRPRYWLRVNRETDMATHSSNTPDYQAPNIIFVPSDTSDGHLSTSTKDRRMWSEAEEATLISFLKSHRSEAGDGLNFSKKFWTKAAVSPAKEAEHCAGKWGRQSGFHWDDIGGAGITVESETVWAEYLKKNPGVKIFCNKGWTHFSAMDNLMCGRFAKGANIFRSAPPSVPVPNSPPVSSITPSSSTFPPPVAITPQMPRSINTNMHSHDANINLWLGGVPSPELMPAPSTLSSTTSRGSSSSKQKERDAELDANADADAMSVVTHSKSTGITVHSRSSKTPCVAANAMTATALTGLNDTLGQIVPIMKGITDTIRNEFDTPLTKQGSSSAVIPSSVPGTSTITPSSFISHYNFDIAKQPSHIQRGIAIQALQELDHELGIPKQVELLHIFEREIGVVDMYLNMLHATDLRRVWISSFTKV